MIPASIGTYTKDMIKPVGIDPMERVITSNNE